MAKQNPTLGTDPDTHDGGESVVRDLGKPLRWLHVNVTVILAGGFAVIAVAVLAAAWVAVQIGGSAVGVFAMVVCASAASMPTLIGQIHAANKRAEQHKAYHDALIEIASRAAKVSTERRETN